MAVQPGCSLVVLALSQEEIQGGGGGITNEGCGLCKAVSGFSRGWCLFIDGMFRSMQSEGIPWMSVLPESSVGKWKFYTFSRALSGSEPLNSVQERGCPCCLVAREVWSRLPSLHCQRYGACILLAAMLWLLSWTKAKENLLLLLLCSVDFSVQTHDLVRSALSPVNMITASVDLMNFPALFYSQLSNTACCLSCVSCLHVFVCAYSFCWYFLQELQPGMPSKEAKKYPVSLPHH